MAHKGTVMFSDCTRCGKVNDADMRFCQHCGAELEVNRMRAPASNPIEMHCYHCDRSDLLNRTFCLYCGTPLSSQAIAEDGLPARKAPSGNRPKTAKKKHTPQVVALTGSVIAVCMVSLCFIKLPKPHAGLIISDGPPGASLIIEDAKHFVAATGELDEAGMHRVNTLAPGEYFVRLIGKDANKKHVSYPIRLVDGKTASLQMIQEDPANIERVKAISADPRPMRPFKYGTEGPAQQEDLTNPSRSYQSEGAQPAVYTGDISPMSHGDLPGVPQEPVVPGSAAHARDMVLQRLEKFRARMKAQQEAANAATAATAAAANAAENPPE